MLTKREEVILRIWRLLTVKFVFLILLGGCVSLPSDFKEPGVSVISVTPKISNGISPQFDIKLRVTNPNREALSIAGLAYTIHISGNKVIEGVANELPNIAAYGEADVTLNATANLFSGFKLLTDLLDNPTAPVDYEFNAQIDIGPFYPMINIKRAGVLSLN